MINFLKGQVVEVVTLPNQRVILILEVNQIGYEIQIPARFTKQLAPKAEIIQIFTHLQLREDSTTLFGFASPPERDLFRQFISVTGIGAQLAIALIDTLGSEELVSAIVTGNTRLLCQAPGVGKKTAERLALELKTKLSQWHGISTISLPTGSALPPQAIVEDLELTLAALGYSDQEITQALTTLSQDETLQASTDSEAWLRKAIAWLSTQT
jgi:Holliday junction DNA helicase RuvA